MRAADLVGIVLAAGRSSRMGRPKALLPIGLAEAGTGPQNETFTAHIVRVLQAGGIEDVAVVGRPGDDALRAEVGALGPAARYLANPAPDRGQLSSLLVGLEYADGRGAGGVLVLPVDIPLVTDATVARLVKSFVSSSAAIVRATHGGRHGHPVIFRKRVFDDLRAADMGAGAKAVLTAHAGDLLDVEVDDPGVLRDVDVPDDYRRLFGSLPE